MRHPVLVAPEDLAARLSRVLRGAGASDESGSAAVQAMMHASRIGVDSHGARLVRHYSEVLQTGRLNPRPQLTVRRTAAATAVVDADDGLGHYAAYRAMEEASRLALESGMGAVGVIRSSHFGAAGAYAIKAAEAGLIGFATTNSDSGVSLFSGTRPFHGTNPLAIAAPNPQGRPWLLDMATSSIPFNRVFLYRSLGQGLPDGVAADAEGTPTRDAEQAAMLLPLGGTDYGFKGAALAGVATLLSGVLQGMALDHAMLPMVGDGDKQTPRRMGHFVFALDPARFGGAEMFAAGMTSYLAAIRGAAAQPGTSTMAPGDREWRVEAERQREGIPIDADTADFLGIR